MMKLVSLLIKTIMKSKICIFEISSGKMMKWKMIKWKISAMSNTMRKNIRRISKMRKIIKNKYDIFSKNQKLLEKLIVKALFLIKS